MRSVASKLADVSGIYGEQVLPPVAKVPIFLCIGLNYLDHAQEAGVRLSPCSLFPLVVDG
jgi:2-keto-4-pentenoate hydratase/2-oxohepta-3-ene-1,7-dioic acid hydratase in catechol pathway